MKAVIIGCNGYIGSHLATCLQQQGWDVHGVARSAAAAVPLSRYTQMDVTDKEQFSRLDMDADFIFYFAGITGTAAAYDDIDRYIDVNEKGLLRLLQQTRQQSSRARIVFPSSRLVYKGEKDTPLKEDAEKEFKTIYALNKLFGEQVLHQYSVYFGIPFTVFRICVPYGNLFNSRYSYGTIGFFLDKAMKGEPISLFGDGLQKRTFTHVEDVGLQVYQALRNPASENMIYNISGETFSLKEVAQRIAGKFKVPLLFKDWPPMDKLLETGDTIFDGSRIMNIIPEPLKNNFESWLDSIKDEKK